MGGHGAGVDRGADAPRLARHLWQRGSLWGDEALSFEVTQDGRTERITLKPQDYTVNIPLSVTMASQPAFSYELGKKTLS